jgi:glycosyltransferase involved in cell wall biosynthesis
LEAIIEVMSRMEDGPALYLRGNAANGYQQKLVALAQTLGVAERVHFLPIASPEQMVRLSAEYSLGLSLELNEPPNRAICLTNKAFTYLLAGVPVLLSRTPAQAALAAELGEAAILVDLENPAQVSKTLTSFFKDTERQERAYAEAWRFGRQRYNWDIERHRFLCSIEGLLRSD